jgi:TldD protein
MPPPRRIDPAFLALPLDRLADAALTTAKAAGATHADVRVERLRGQQIVVRDQELQTAADTETVGLSVRVIHRGACRARTPQHRAGDPGR